MSLIVTKYRFPLQRMIQVAAPIVGLCFTQDNLRKRSAALKVSISSILGPYCLQWPIFPSLFYYQSSQQYGSPPSQLHLSKTNKAGSGFSTVGFYFYATPTDSLSVPITLAALLFVCFMHWVEIGHLSRSLWFVKFAEWKINYIIILA